MTLGVGLRNVNCFVPNMAGAPLHWLRQEDDVSWVRLWATALFNQRSLTGFAIRVTAYHKTGKPWASLPDARCLLKLEELDQAMFHAGGGLPVTHLIGRRRMADGTSDALGIMGKLVVTSDPAGRRLLIGDEAWPEFIRVSLPLAEAEAFMGTRPCRWWPRVQAWWYWRLVWNPKMKKMEKRAMALQRR